MAHRVKKRREVLAGGSKNKTKRFCLSCSHQTELLRLLLLLYSRTHFPLIKRIMSGDDGGKKLTAQEAAIIEMLKQQNLDGNSAGGDDDGKKKHAFWDTQVG